MSLPPVVRDFATRVRAAGGRALLIGGAVRDALLKLPVTDYDLEVYGLPPARVRALAEDVLGGVRDVGRGFGVLEARMPPDPSSELDAGTSEVGEGAEPTREASFSSAAAPPSLRALPAGGAKQSPRRGDRGIATPRPLERGGAREDRFLTAHLTLPRRESKVSRGHRGFAVDTDPSLSPEESARRRDFTINAIAADPLTGEVLDPFDGRDDLERKILRVVDARTFGDDPLRVLRGAVFAAQFGLSVDAASESVIRAAVPRLTEISRERVGGEWEKLLLRPEKPSVGLKLLMGWGVSGVLHPEFATLPEIPQSPQWHPEGDVWTHTCMAVDEAARIVREPSLRAPPAGGAWQSRRGGGDQGIASSSLDKLGAPRNDEWQWHVLLATLCHDLGKATTTTTDARGHIHSRGHDAAGVAPTRAFLKQIAADRRTGTVVLRLVREHLQPLHFFNAAARGQPVTDGTLRRLARRLHPATIFLLSLVADADHRGRGFPGGQSPAAAAGKQLRRRSETLGVLHGPPAPVLRGADLIALGLQPGPHFGEILRWAEELRDEGLTKEEILERVRSRFTHFRSA